ncbi:hypothetical protein GCM10010360_26720 [Streptomyces nogalater]
MSVPWPVSAGRARTAGLEGLCFKRLDEPYRPTRSRRKYKERVTTEAVIGAVTGSLTAPRTVLLDHYDTAGQNAHLAFEGVPARLCRPMLCSPHPVMGQALSG